MVHKIDIYAICIVNASPVYVLLLLRTFCTAELHLIQIQESTYSSDVLQTVHNTTVSLSTATFSLKMATMSKHILWY